MLLLASRIILGWSGISLLLAMGVGRFIGKGSLASRAVYYIPSSASAFRLMN